MGGHIDWKRRGGRRIYVAVWFEMVVGGQKDERGAIQLAPQKTLSDWGLGLLGVKPITSKNIHASGAHQTTHNSSHP